ncbi:PWWP domain-containing DNA repair factor 3B-like isoform 1-T3 [Thomomys bottae]
MNTVEYVLCSWKGHLWPAKVLPSPISPATSKGKRGLPLEVEILAVDERVQVKSTDVKGLTEAEVEAIASSAGVRLGTTDPPGDSRWKATTPPGQSRAYRKALRLALEILYCRKLVEQGTNVVSSKIERKGTRSGPQPDTGSGSGSGHRPCRKYRKRKLYYRSRLRKQAYLQSQQVCQSDSEHDLHDKKSKAHTATASSPGETQEKILEKSIISPNTPILTRAASEKENEENLGISTLVSSPHAASKKENEKRLAASTPVSPIQSVVWNHGYDKAEFPGLSMRPVVVLTRHNILSPKSQDTSQENTASEPQRINTFTEIREHSGNAVLEGAVLTSPNSCPIANRKRKCWKPALKRGGKKIKSPEHSPETKVVASRKRVGNSQEGLTKNVARGRRPSPIKRGMMVWFKLHDQPFWPAVVKSVSQIKSVAKVLLIEANLCPERSGIQVSLCRLKHLECKEKDVLMKRASKVYGFGVTWCFSLISHYQEEVAQGSFTGSFLEYYATDASYPARKALEETDMQLDFPKVNYADLEESDDETFMGVKRPRKKLLPDRMKAAWDRGNGKLVDFIIRRRGSDQHLLDIINGKKKSTWLTSFLKSYKSSFCIETYLEDDDQLFIVVKHLQKVYEQTEKVMFHPTKGDNVSFVMEVLLPEAMIYSIATVEDISYQEAEEKYMQGPPVHYREKAEFDKKVIKEQRRKRLEISSQFFRSPSTFNP